MIVDMGPMTEELAASDVPKAIFRSDLFGRLYDIIRAIPGLSDLLNSLIRVEFVLDANIVLGEIRFRLTRRNPEARSDLAEAIDSGIVIAIAPKYLATEIDDEHLSRILGGTGKTVSDARREWENLREKIRLYEPMSDGDPTHRAIDPDDVAYAVTCEEVGAHAIHSRDRHLKKMGAPVVKGTPDRALRDCARSGAVVLGITATSGLAITVTYASIRGAWLLLEKTVEGFRLLPPWAKLLLLGLGVALVAQPRFRAGAAQRWERFRGEIASRMPDLLDALQTIGQWAVAYQEAEEQAARSKAQVEELLPPPKAKTLIQHVRSACLQHDGPLSLDEIVRRIKLDGYRSASSTGCADLREVLNSSGQFAENKKGEWSMSKPATEPPSIPKSASARRRLPVTRRRSLMKNQGLERPRSPQSMPRIDS